MHEIFMQCLILSLFISSTTGLLLPKRSTPKTRSTIASKQLNYCNSQDKEFPWLFSGRAVMQPALVRVNSQQSNEKIVPLSFFGWTLGGTVALEYDESPVGPYREFVTLGGLAIYPHSSGRLLVGQFGSNLYVNKKQAETLCQQVWDLKATPAEINFKDDGDSVILTSIQENWYNSTKISVNGWKLVKQCEQSGPRNMNNIPLLWTPKIKAIWMGFARLPNNEPVTDLSLNKLRLSGTINLALNKPAPSTPNTIPLGVTIMLQNALIEISPRIKD